MQSINNWIVIKGSKRRHFLLALAGSVALLIMDAIVSHTLLASYISNDEAEPGQCLYIDEDDTPDSVKLKSRLGWRWDVYKALLPTRVRTGRYLMEPGMTHLQLYRNLRNGMQEPLNLTIPTSRSMTLLAKSLSQHLMIDSATIAAALCDSNICARYGYTKATIPALFVPDTYEVYWNMTIEGLLDRMAKENAHFWNKERLKKAEECGLTREEVVTLASIVDEETANDSEKPMIAGLYMNRLRMGMPLQADPTVRFAVGDFTLHRILHTHLLTESPYNTYLYAGLPPGPIRIASQAGIDAVLGYTRHHYIYMCAKEDFSGTHNFAATYDEHIRNARRYTKALNKRGIK